ncbi:MAG TPA: hypothetical protein VGN18_13160 [Jatrophihabitans sp.]|jgi:hypothetical protein|uniref:hypothetical protein n=1 Tax=Jatrophihabitans sp. TaxID=1932789 RepID=UPI002E01E0F3|nr:hypothetical protein [Jatrophihabitans sp.]
MTTLASVPDLRSAPPIVRPRPRVPAWTLPPVLFAVANAVAFFVIRPDVNDLWAARARASAVSNGVGLFYWFGWFGGGSTPGNYSVVTPYLCSWIGTELVGALAAVAATVLCVVAVRGTRHPRAASFVAAFVVSTNLWSGRIPFLLGSALAVAAVIAVRRKQRWRTVGFTLLSIMASPVSGAFIAVGLTGTFLCTRTRAYRPIIGWAVGTAVVAIGGVGLLFGAPGPEPFSGTLLLELVASLLLLIVAARPPDHIRTTLWISLITCLALFAVPNGMGSNFSRFVWFCLPVVVMAVGRASRRLLTLAVLPLILVGASGTVTDLRNAERPVSSVDYYTSLAGRLDRIPNLENYRVEVVNHGAHAGYDALLSHASLARGWETQEDIHLNAALQKDPLDPTTYKVWLDNNAVGYVALPTSHVGGGSYPEYTLVTEHAATYLHRIWANADWELFRVADPTPIVGSPGRIAGHTQSTMTVTMPCACSVNVRVRYSKFLSAALQVPSPTAPQRTVDAAVDAASVVDDGTGWTTLTTTRAGTFTLRGSLGGLLR